MTNNLATIKSYLERDDIAKKFETLLGEKSQSFLTTVLGAISQNEKLAKADPKTIYLASLVSATLDLSVNPNFGRAYIVPYYDKNTKTHVAQFQMGYKGFIQLAQRSGQFKTISATEVYEGQLIEANPLTGYVFDFSKKESDTVIGYAGYFKLLTGFEKTLYMTKEEAEKHGKKYSKAYGYLWSSDFDAMATKTVLKLLLSKYAPMSIMPQMQTAVSADQSVVRDESMENFEYIDNPPMLGDAVVEMSDDVKEHREKSLADCKSIEEVDELMDQNKVTDKNVLSLFEKRKDELTK